MDVNCAAVVVEGQEDERYLKFDRIALHDAYLVLVVAVVVEYYFHFEEYLAARKNSQCRESMVSYYEK